MTSRSNYFAGGVRLRSQLPLPELQGSGFGGEPDVEVEVIPGPEGRVATGEWSTLVGDENQLRLIVPGVANYLVTNGRHVLIEKDIGAASKDVRVFLYATVWAGICHQRGLFPLHASAVASSHGVVAFLGEQGDGKSSMAAAMAHRGFPLTNDDVLVLEDGADNGLIAWPFLRRSKLRADTIETIGRPRSEAEAVRFQSDKWWVAPPVASDMVPMRLHRIYVLERGDASLPPRFERLTGASAVQALVEHTFRLFLIHSPDQHRRHLAMCAAVTSQCEVYRLIRPFDLDRLTEVATAVARHCEVPPAHQFARSGDGRAA